MHIDSATSQRNGKTYTRHLLRTSYREGGKVKKRTIANLSHCSDAEINAIRLALQHKNDLATLGSPKNAIELQQGRSVAAVVTIYQVAKRLGIVAAQTQRRPRQAHRGGWGHSAQRSGRTDGSGSHQEISPPKPQSKLTLNNLVGDSVVPLNGRHDLCLQSFGHQCGRSRAGLATFTVAGYRGPLARICLLD